MLFLGIRQCMSRSGGANHPGFFGAGDPDRPFPGEDVVEDEVPRLDPENTFVAKDTAFQTGALWKMPFPKRPNPDFSIRHGRVRLDPPPLKLKNLLTS